MPLTDSGPWLRHLDGLSQQFDEMVQIDGFREDDPEEKKLVQILHRACEVVYDAEKKAAPALPEIVERAQRLLDRVLEYIFEDRGDPDDIHCFAYSKDCPVVEDSLKMTGCDVVETFSQFHSEFLYLPTTERPELPEFARTEPWTQTRPPHPQSTRLSRFRNGITPSVPSTATRAQLVFEARAQVTEDLMSPLYAMRLSADGSFLAMASSSGYKSRDPILHYSRLSSPAASSYSTDDSDCDGDGEKDDGGDLLGGVHMESGFTNVADHLELDDARQLVFLADDDRIKSFSWATPASDTVSENAPKRTPLSNVHTMDSQRTFSGPLAVLPGGRILRAGTGAAAVWNLDALETHQNVPKGTLLGGGSVNMDNSLREADASGIEHSRGIAPHAVVAFADDPELKPTAWHWHAPTRTMLCAYEIRDEVLSISVACVAVDVEHGGKRVARYLGHGSEHDKFATSAGDPNVFWTAGADGFARMFDVRRPLPVLTLNTGARPEPCVDVVFVHPDGIPVVFTGGKRTQQVKMWDIRGRACVYELSTGNNAVRHMLWDDTRTTLMVSTEKGFGWGMGGTKTTRQAKIPHWATWDVAKEAALAYRTGGGAMQTTPEQATVSEAADAGSEDNQDVEMGGLSDDDDDVDSGDDEDSDEDDKDEHDRDDGGNDLEVQDDNDNASEEELDDIDKEYSKEKRWPTHAYHDERFFGYAYSASGSGLLRFQFKENPTWGLPPTASRWM